VSAGRDLAALGEAEDWIPTLVAAVPPGSRVLVLGAFPRPLLGALAARGCQVTLGGERRVDVEAPGGEVDAVLLPALQGPAIDKALAGARRLLAEEGRVVALVRNAGYAGHRLDMLRGRLGQVDLAALLLPVEAAEELLGDAGLSVAERIPVLRPLEIDAAPAVRDELLAAPDALAWAHVLVAVPAVPAATAGPDPAAPLRRRVAELTARLTELDAVLRERIAELEAVHEERRHLELDLAVKDAFVGELLDRLSAAEAAMAGQAALDAELREMTRYRVADAVHARISAVPAIHRPLRAAARWQRERRTGRG